MWCRRGIFSIFITSPNTVVVPFTPSFGIVSFQRTELLRSRQVTDHGALQGAMEGQDDPFPGPFWSMRLSQAEGTLFERCQYVLTFIGTYEVAHWPSSPSRHVPAAVDVYIARVLRPPESLIDNAPHWSSRGPVHPPLVYGRSASAGRDRGAPVLEGRPRWGRPLFGLDHRDRHRSTLSQSHDSSGAGWSCRTRSSSPSLRLMMPQVLRVRSAAFDGVGARNGVRVP